MRISLGVLCIVLSEVRQVFFFFFWLYREMNRQSFRCFGGPSSGEWEVNSVYKHLAFALRVIDFRQYSDRVALKVVFCEVTKK